MNAQQKLQHLYWRAGFGPRPQDVAAGLSTGKALRQLLREAAHYEPIAGRSLYYEDPQGAVMAVPPGAPTPPARRNGRAGSRRARGRAPGPGRVGAAGHGYPRRAG